MEIRELSSPHLCKPLGVYSHAIEVINPEKLIFVSGFTSRDQDGNVLGKGDIKVQTDAVLRSIQTILKEAGATMKDIVKMTIYIRDMNMFKEIHEVRARYFSQPVRCWRFLEWSIQII